MGATFNQAGHKMRGLVQQLPLICVAALIVVLGGCGQDESPEALSQANLDAWKQPGADESSGDSESVRQEIAAELEECDCLEGRSRAEVIRMFGEPTRIGALNTSYVEGGEAILRYRLGYCAGLGRCLFEEETEYLDIYLDSDDAVLEVWVVAT